MKRFFTLSTKNILGSLFMLCLVASVSAQNIGDYRTHQNGNWNDPNTWEYYNGASWVYPASTYPVNNISTVVTIIAGDTITATNDISGDGYGQKADLEIYGTLDMGSYAIQGLGSNADYFEYIRIYASGNLTALNYVNTDTFYLAGTFKTSFSGMYGWWNDAAYYPPTGLQLIGTIHYSGGNQVVYCPIDANNAAISQGSLIISGTGTKSLTSPIKIMGSINVQTGSTLNINGQTVTSLGSGLTNNGTMLCNSGSFFFNYQGTQSFTGTGSYSNTLNSVTLGDGTSRTNIAKLSFSSSRGLNLNTLTISKGSTMTLDATSKLTINTIISNAQPTGLILQSSATSSASLINQGTSSGTVKVERYIIGNTWHNLSAPVNGQPINTTFFTSNSIPSKMLLVTTYGMEYYDESTGWKYYDANNISSAGNFIPGKGYMMRRSADGVIAFAGTLNVGNIPVTLARTAFGWNAVGNPYTSAMVANAITNSFLNVNSASLDPNHAALYMWNGGTTYITINNATPETHLQPGQGFIVKAAANGSVINFTSAMQLHDNGSTLYKKSGSTSWNDLSLTLKTSSDSSSTDIKFRSDMTKGLDVTYDAGQFGGSSVLNLYSRLVNDDSVNFAIQCLPDTAASDMVIPLGVACSAGGEVSFSALTNALPAGYSAILEDRQLNTFTDLSNPADKYTVALPANTSGIGRFFLHTKNATTGIRNANANALLTYAANHHIYIKGELPENTIASLYDLSGRELVRVELHNADFNTLDAENLTNGIYILVLSGKQLHQSSKIALY